MGAVSHADSDVVAYWWLTGVFTGVCRIATPLDFPALSGARAISLSELNFLLSPFVGHLVIAIPRALHIGSSKIYAKSNIRQVLVFSRPKSLKKAILSTTTAIAP